MKAVLGADPHGTGRTPEELHYSIEVFEDAYRLAVEHEAEYVFWLGDLLHFKYGLELTLLLRWAEVINKYRAEGVETIMIPGNHDKPWEDDPTRTAIAILPAVVYTQPTAWEADGALYAFLPWFPPAEFKRYAWQLAAQAANFPGRKFLFSHTPLAEGFVSASNIQVEQPIRIADLYTDYWDKIFLGDYHAHQTLGPKIVYLGAPRPTTFGDQNCRGYWLFESGGGLWNFKNLPLPSAFPEYIQHTIGPFGPPSIPNYRKINKYHLKVASNWVGEVGVRYPDGNVRVTPLSNQHSIAAQVKFSAEDLATPFATFRKWLRLVDLPEAEYYPIGEEALKKCWQPGTY